MRQKRALFEAWRGRYNDSPKVVSEALRKTSPGVHQTWVSSSRGVFPSGTNRVARHTPRHFVEMARCDLLVTNDIVTRHIVKGPRVVYVQTWHGSPIKVLGLHERTPKYRNGKVHLARTRRDVRKWDYLLSASAQHTEIFRGAFGYDGEILEIGYPRNDILVNDDGSRRSTVRRSLGIAPDQMVVLYAPTWRDDAHRSEGGFYQPDMIDWSVLFEALPDGAVVLNRLHQNVSTATVPGANGRIIEASQHEDVVDLILASDVLVSDYSSLIYDYAVYGRPIILHAPDLEHYRDIVRGFYFEYDSWAPGPITSTTLELATALNGVREVEENYATRYRDFVQTYCTFEDGRAAERLVSTLVARHLG